MPRLFIGTFLEPTEQERFASLPIINEHLEAKWQRKPRWVKPDKLHVTWLFLGSIEPELVDKVQTALRALVTERRQALRNAEEKSFELELNVPEVWPSSRRPRLIVVANKPINRAATSLSRAIRRGMIPFFTEETVQEQNQEFKPHLTFIRLDRRADNPTDKLELHSVTPRVDPQLILKLPEFLPIKMPIEKVCLVESQVAGHYYRILDTVPLDA